MAQAPFVLDPHLTGIAIAYKNEDYIADQVLPEITVPQKEYKYTSYPAAESFGIPNTLVGRKGQVREIELTGVDATGTALDYGINDSVPQDDIDQALARKLPNPLDRATERVTDVVLLDRELRTANKVFALATYPSGNRTTLSGSSQFSDPTSDPLGVILDALDTMMMRANTIVFGQASWTKVRQHPKIVKATNANSGDSGAAALQAVADLFEVKRILVGRSRLNSARPGQTANLTRVWGKHISLLYINPLSDAQTGITFGWTAKYGTREAFTYFDNRIGARGAQVARAVNTTDERVVASDCGYFIQNAVA